MERDNELIPIDSCVIRRNGKFRVIFSPLGIDEWVDGPGLRKVLDRVMASGIDDDSKLLFATHVQQSAREWQVELEAESRQSSASLWLIDGFFLVVTFIAGVAVGKVWL